MTDYFVTRLFRDGTATDRVILFHAPCPKKARAHVRRIEAISDWRHVGAVQSPRDDLDRLTGEHGVVDTMLLRRAGLDVTEMGA